MLLKALSQTLVKEHHFKFTVGAETHLFLVEELVAKLSNWPARFRLRLDAFHGSEAKTFYGASCYEVAEKAADFLALSGSSQGIIKTTHSPQNPPASPRQTLRPLQIQESESD
ncbi:MAG TPA: hypothetical protein VJW94_13455 [Candidatus Acidoferrum sp.]|nr:hypothetical protein [Candidatus Acidoferrum sp.]